jgi:membrane dipeptidase
MLKIFDLHCDTPHNISKHKFNHIIPGKLYRQNYYGAIFAHFVRPESKYHFLDVIKLLASTVSYINKKKNIHIVRSHKDLDENKVNIILGVEGGHIFDKTFEQIEILYKLGIRVFTITWNNSNKLAHSALEADRKGITKKGRNFLKELKNYDVVLDLSHASTRTVLDVCEKCENQVIASHSCVRALKPSFLRNISDRAIKAIAKKGGVVGVNFSKYHLGNNKIVDHIDYLTDKFGIATPAIGSDFDGINDAVIETPDGIRSLEKELIDKGYKRKEIGQVFHQNFLRVFKKA